MGSVWLVEHGQTRARRALKLIRATGLREAARARREVEALSLVDGHPNVVRVHDCGELPEGGLWIVLDLAEGGDLATRLTAGPLPVAEVVRLGRDLARGLAHVHAKGVLHRDLKPANVLFDAHGTPRLIDFGVAQVAGAEPLTRTGDLVGTPRYLAPEVLATGAREADARTDVWGLGAILYEALTGARPIEASNVMVYFARATAGSIQPPSRRRPGVPRALDHVLLRALAADPRDRFPTAAALGEALARFDDRPGREGVARGGLGRAATLAAGALVLLAVVAAAWPGAEPSGGGAPALDPGRRPVVDDPLATAAVLSALLAEAPAPILSALEARRAELIDSRPLQGALAGALLVADDPAAVARWRAAAPELAPLLDGVGSLVGAPGEVERAAPLPVREAVARPLRAARAAPRAVATTRGEPLLATFEAALEEAERRLDAGPLDLALRVVLVRAVLARDTSLFHVADRHGSAGSGDGLRAERIVQRAARLVEAGPARAALLVVDRWLVGTRVDASDAGDAGVAALPARYLPQRFVHLARRLGAVDARDAALVAARWAEVLGLAVQLGLLTPDGETGPATLLEDLPRVQVAINATAAWSDLLARAAWAVRDGPAFEERAAAGLAAAERLRRCDSDRGALHVARIQLLRGDVAAVRSALITLKDQRHIEGTGLAFEAELHILERHLETALGVVARLGRRPEGTLRVWAKCLQATISAVRGDFDAAEAALAQARSLEVSAAGGRISGGAFGPGDCPWRTADETARQVAACRGGWRPHETGRPWAP
jgi:hypothetical protein